MLAALMVVSWSLAAGRSKMEVSWVVGHPQPINREPRKASSTRRSKVEGEPPLWAAAALHWVGEMGVSRDELSLLLHLLYWCKMLFSPYGCYVDTGKLLSSHIKSLCSTSNGQRDRTSDPNNISWSSLVGE